MLYDQSTTVTEQLHLSDGGIILVEVNAEPHFDGPVSVQTMQISAQQALKSVTGLATDLKEAIAKAKPDKATVEFSIELEKKGDDVLSKICNLSGKGTVKFTLEWNFADTGPKD